MKFSTLEHFDTSIIWGLPQSIAIFDTQMNYLAYSKKWFDDFNLETQTVYTGKSHYEIFPDIPDAWKEVHQKCMAGETLTKEADKFTRQDGSVYYLDWEVKPWHDEDGRIGGIVMTSTDVTSKVELISKNHELDSKNVLIDVLLSTQKELRWTSELFETLANQSVAGLYVVQDGYMVYANQKYADILGYEHPNQIINKIPVLDLVAQNSKELAQDNINRRIFGNEKALHYDVTLIKKDGTEVLAEAHGGSTLYKGKIGIAGLIIDKSDIKDMKLQLSRSEERFKLLFDQAPVGIALVDPQGHTVMSNQALCDLLGYTSEDLKEMAFTEFTHPEDRVKDLDQYKKLINRDIDSYTMEKRYITKDGSLLYANVTVSAVFNPDDSIFYGIGIVNDITEKKKLQLEAALLREGQLENQAQLLKNIAHHWLNPLNIIAGTLSYAADVFKQSQIHEAKLEELLKSSTKKAYNLLENIKQFSKGYKPTQGESDFDLVELIREVHSLITPLLSAHSIGCDLNLPSKAVFYNGSKGNILHILMNICFNAIESINRRALRDSHFSKTICLSVSENHKDIEITITDKGESFSDEALKHLFEPYSSDHKLDSGTGLSLFNAHRIIKASGGDIQASNIADGAMVKITLHKNE